MQSMAEGTFVVLARARWTILELLPYSTRADVVDASIPYLRMKPAFGMQKVGCIL